jgi:hypothetical protein
VDEHTHHFLQGGRGAGKTITLRKLGAALSPAQQGYPHLGLYLPLDVTQFASFDESKIGGTSGWLFEAYFSGIIVQELLRALLPVGQRLEFRRLTTEQFCHRITKILADSPPGPLHNLEALHQAIGEINQQLMAEVSKRLGSLRQSDFRVVCTFFKLREITDLIADEITIAGTRLTTLLLLDRYDDLTNFQQTIANSLFNLPPPRNLYVIAGIAPPGPASLDLANGQKLQQY